jgi:hypothetical protein
MKGGTQVSDRSVIQISRPVYDQLMDIKRERAARLGRQVTFTEIIEDLLETAEVS